MERTAHGGLGQLQFFGDGRNRRPALSILIGSVRKVNINGYRTVRQIHAVQEIKSAHPQSPPPTLPGPSGHGARVLDCLPWICAPWAFSPWAAHSAVVR